MAGHADHYPLRGDVQKRPETDHSRMLRFQPQKGHSASAKADKHVCDGLECSRPLLRVLHCVNRLQHPAAPEQHPSSTARSTPDARPPA